MAVEVARAGMDPLEFLSSSDPVRVLVMHKIAREFRLQIKDEYTFLAQTIVNTLAKAMKSKG